MAKSNEELLKELKTYNEHKQRESDEANALQAKRAEANKRAAEKEKGA